MQGLLRMADKYPIIDVRGRGLMCAVEFGGHDGGLSASPGIAAAITKAAGKRNMLLLVAGVGLNMLKCAACATFKPSIINAFSHAGSSLSKSSLAP